MFYQLVYILEYRFLYVCTNNLPQKLRIVRRRYSNIYSIGSHRTIFGAALAVRNHSHSPPQPPTKQEKAHHRFAPDMQDRDSNQNSNSFGASSPTQLKSPLSAFWADYAKWLLAHIDSDSATSAAKLPVATFLSPNAHTAPLDFTTAIVATGILAASFAQGATSETVSNSDAPEASGRSESSQKVPPKHSQRYDGCTLHFTAASPVAVFLQETTVAEEELEEEDSLMKDVDEIGAETLRESERETENTKLKKVQKTEAAHKQLLGYLALIDPEFPTTEDEETGEQQVWSSLLRVLIVRVTVYVFVVLNYTGPSLHYSSSQCIDCVNVSETCGAAQFSVPCLFRFVKRMQVRCISTRSV